MLHKVELHSLKTNKEEKKREVAHQPSMESDYPWGTRLDLDQSVVDKVPGLKKAEVGDRLMIEAEAVVIRRSSSATATKDGSEEHVTVELQLTSLGCINKEDYSEAFKEAGEHKK